MASNHLTQNRLTRRKQFLYVARGKRVAKTNLVVQARRSVPAHAHIKTGFTATRKTGNAVRRNRAKRRLRAASQQLLGEFGTSGWDYVFIARMKTADAKWNHLLDDMKAALLSLQSNATSANTSSRTLSV